MSLADKMLKVDPESAPAILTLRGVNIRMFGIDENMAFMDEADAWLALGVAHDRHVVEVDLYAAGAGECCRAMTFFDFDAKPRSGILFKAFFEILAVLANADRIAVRHPDIHSAAKECVSELYFKERELTT